MAIATYYKYDPETYEFLGAEDVDTSVGPWPTNATNISAVANPFWKIDGSNGGEYLELINSLSDDQKASLRAYVVNGSFIQWQLPKKLYEFDVTTGFYTGNTIIGTVVDNPVGYSIFPLPEELISRNIDPQPIEATDVYWSPGINYSYPKAYPAGNWMTPVVNFYYNRFTYLYTGYTMKSSGMVDSYSIQNPVPPNWRNSESIGTYKFNENSYTWEAVANPGSLEGEKQAIRTALDASLVQQVDGYSVLEQHALMLLSIEADMYQKLGSEGVNLQALATLLNLSISDTAVYVIAQNADNPLLADGNLAIKYRKQIQDATNITQLPSVQEVNQLTGKDI